MNCPYCKNVHLVMADRQGIEIDYCPNCRGVWLDRGELDKIIERTAAILQTPETPRSQDHPPVPKGPRKPVDYDDRYRYKKRKRGLLGELFDFD